MHFTVVAKLVHAGQSNADVTCHNKWVLFCLAHQKGLLWPVLSSGVAFKGAAVPVAACIVFQKLGFY